MVEITDKQASTLAFRSGAERRVSIDVLLPSPTAEASKVLDVTAWEDGLVRLVECATLAAQRAAWNVKDYEREPSDA